MFNAPLFNAPRYVIKDGNIIIEEHEIRTDYGGRILHATPEYDGDIEHVIRPFFEDHYPIRRVEPGRAADILSERNMTTFSIDNRLRCCALCK